MSWSHTAQHVIRVAADWFFRVRTPEGWIFRGAVALLVVLNGADWVLKYRGPIGDRAGVVEFATAGVVPIEAYWAVTILCVVLMIGSVAWAWKRYSNDQALFRKKKVLVIEARGLRDESGAPLDAAVPPSIEGIRTPYVLDVRQYKDGVIVDPAEALTKVSAMKTWLHQMERGKDRESVAIVYGGLAAVPVTFLTGVLLDDEGPVTVMDWDRTAMAWRALNDADDGMRFEITGLEAVRNAREVVLAVSASYHVKDEDLATTFAHPTVRMSLPSLTSSHWSQEKQSALAEQFLDTAKQLDALGVQQIHLVLAAQNSVVFNLGKRYDKRNLPNIAVYQFERGQAKRYPWAIQMPVAGAAAAQVSVPSEA